MSILFLFFIIFTQLSCNIIEHNAPADTVSTKIAEASKYDIIAGAEHTAKYLPKLQNKKVGLVINQSSKVGSKGLLDTLLSLEVDITALYTPEHGLDGIADAGEKVDNGKYRGIPVYSLYGKNKKPSTQQLFGVDVLVFDIQDVGARFYTYISTLHYVMEAAAEAMIPVIVLDRPNPNGFYVDGPLLEPEYQSFVGMHPVPVVHGMTIGEYAQMVTAEGWLKDSIKCEVEVIGCTNYDHTMTYDLPIKPSPNLPNLRSILLYPSLCFFEGTTLSVGRGTEQQFQLIGHPAIDTTGAFGFTPISRSGAKYPKHENQACYGEAFTMPVGQLMRESSLQLSHLIKYHKLLTDKGVSFFNDNNFFEKLAGTKTLRAQLEQGLTEEEIRATWQDDLKAFKQTRKKYLLYPDFE